MEILGANVSPVTIPIVLLAALVMAYFANKEIKARRQGGHADYKSLIVSIGVLGTFIGIFIGLWEFDTQNIQASVPKLLEGLKLAFLTSIMGMSVSVLLASLEKADAAAFADEADALASINDRLSPLQQIAESNAAVVEQLQNFRMEVRDEQAKSRHFVEEQFRETNDSLKVAIDQLAKGASSEIVEALKEVITDFNNNLTEQFGDNFKELNAAVFKLVEWQINYRDQIEHNRHLLESISESLRGSDKTISQIAERNEQALAVFSQLGSVIERQTQQLTVAESQIATQQLSLEALATMVPKFESSLEGVAEKTAQISKEIEENATAQIKAVRSLTEGLESELPKALGQLDQTLAGLTSRFASDYESFLSRYQSLVAPSQAGLDS